MMRKSALVVLVVIGMLLAACGPAMVPSAAPKTETGETFVIALPRIVITLDAKGKPGLEGVALEEIAKTFGMALDLSAYSVDPAYVNWMTNSNIQHVELRQTGAGLALLVNGALMPHIGWSDGSLNQLTDLAPLLWLRQDMVKKFVPIVSRLGLALVLKFPAQAGAKAIPYAADQVALAAAAPAKDPASAVVKFEIKYDAQGVPAILGISAQDLVSMGFDPNLALALHPYYVEMLQLNNVQHLEIRSKSDGLFVYINGTPLPNIVWDGKMLGGMADVVVQLYQTVLSEDYTKLIKQFAPLISNADVGIMIHFPLAKGAVPIPAKMH
jgi:hypothetical protein